MKTAEVSIEYILIGLLAIFAFILPIISGLNISQECLKGEVLAGIIGVAYLFGIIFDKIADTILSPIEQWLRLKQACENITKGNTFYDNDPFPQDILEFKLRGNQDGRLEWMDSLRSRIRTCRGVAVLGLPAAMGITLFQGFMGTTVENKIRNEHLCISLAAINLLFIVGSMCMSKWVKLPKTFDKEDKSRRECPMKLGQQKMRLVILLYVLMLITYAVICLVAGWKLESFKFLFTGFFGIVFSLLALYSWYSITKTYMKFICQKIPELVSDKPV